MKSKWLCIPILVLFLIQLACNFPGQVATETSPEQSLAVTDAIIVPTSQPFPTQTPLPTYTQAPTQTPFPTNTSFPTQTSHPTSTSQPASTQLAPRLNGALWFEDDCADIGEGRALFGLDYMNLAVTQGQCLITANSPGSLLPVMYAFLILDDAAVELDMLIENLKAQSQYGLIFRSDAEIVNGLDYYYFLGFQPAEKLVFFALWDNQQWTVLSKQETVNEIFLPNQLTHIRLEIINNQFRVFLNEQFVLEALNNQISTPGIFGVAIQSSATPETLHYDNLKIYALGP